METVQISATVMKETAKAIKEMADNKDVSFSWMVNHLLTQLALKDKLKKKS